MQIALVGPPLSGKSTLYRAVTEQFEPAHGGSRGVQEQLAVVKVPDPRLDVLAKLYKPKKITQATIDVLDVPGFSQETGQQQAEFRRHLPSLRQCDALVAVVRAFEDDSIPGYRNRIDPRADLDELFSELLFADLETVTTRIERIEKALTKPTGKHDQEKRELAVLQRCLTALEAEQPLSGVIANPDDRKLVGGYRFVTEMPLVVAINVSESAAAQPPAFEYLKARAAIALCAIAEEQIAELEPDDRRAFLDDLGVVEPARDRFVHACYDACGLITFLTCGDKEVRAWPIPRETTAVEAAGKIHTDFARAFIRAETVAYEDLLEAGDMKSAKAAGKVRLEGKTYVVQDGDVILFLANP